MNKECISPLNIDRKVDGVIRYVNLIHDLDPDEIMLHISIEKKFEMEAQYFIEDKKRIKHIFLSFDDLNQWILSGRNRKIVQWLLEGQIIDDPTGQVTTYIRKLSEFPIDLKKKRMLVEFSQFVRRYVESNNFLKQGNVFDSYSNILRGLHHWARLKIIESGQHPEVTVWNQVKQIDPEVYKMYDELIRGEESLEQKIELVLLASEYSILSELKESCELILELMGAEQQPWTFAKLASHPSIYELPIDLDVLLAKMLKRTLIEEVPIQTEDGVQIGYIGH